MRDEASDNKGGAPDEPRQRIQVLVAPRSGGRTPARRAAAIALHPRYVEEERPGSRKQAES